ncbi:FHA domain-containing protein [Halomicrobium zhouii]|uniref:FHA domain-containing protein n=1 Tax=Halomicrobium zhouii TaxID=767519 RepID=A0A1I6KMD7_9EURY|nr:FHA domain-containing protein [Halomicrobium zhouii]SFR92387.1 FHA domain-containing protein [Halomicrobium zhouii]
MSDQSELACVSCETAFDPAPTGGFCPDCDTPHPDFEHGEADDADDAEETGDDEVKAEEAETGATEPTDEEATTSSDDGAAPSYCRECGAAIGAESASSDTTECSDCGRTVAADASYCPDCGTAIEADETADGPEDEPTVVADADSDEAAGDDAATDDDAAAAEAETQDAGTEDAQTDVESPDSGDAESVPEEITLVVNGESYTFGDGDTFGREDEEWLEDLVVAGGGADALSYISSEHVEFAIEDDGVYVTDVSRNGTLLNSTKMEGGTEQVSDGDFLTLAGRAEVEVQF